MPLIKKALLYFLSLGVAAYAAIGYGITPLGSLVHPGMKEGFVAHPVGVLLHVFAAAIALALGPFQFSPHLRRTRRTLHRWMGRVYLARHVRLPQQAAIKVMHAGMAKDQKWMVRNFSLAFAAVMLLLYIPTSVLAGVDFAVAYPVIAWLCWLPNLLVAECVYRTSHFRSPQRTAYNDR